MKKEGANDLLFSWLGIRDDYRTFIEVENLDIVEKPDDDEDAEGDDA